MITLSQLTELLGWASILNIGILLFASIMMVLMRPFITSIHSRMFGIPKNELAMVYFKYLANYKIVSSVLIISPYLSLKIMSY
jgi:hypothetical protein